MGKKPASLLRWTIDGAGREFGIDRKTLAGRLKRGEIEAGADGKFSTKQIVQGIYGDLEFERIRKTREEADQISMENEKARGELVPVDEFWRQIAPCAAKVTKVVYSSRLTPQDQDELLEAFAVIFEPGNNQNTGTAKPGAEAEGTA